MALPLAGIFRLRGAGRSHNLEIAGSGGYVNALLSIISKRFFSGFVGPVARFNGPLRLRRWLWP